MNKRIFLISFIILLGLSLFGIGGWFLFVHGDEPEPVFQRAATALLSSEIAERALVDTDGDGLRDWEEALWKTDPKRTDTDSDGFSDSEETSQGYDPLNGSSNPDTKVKSSSNPPFTENSVELTKPNNPTNLTEGFARTLQTGITNPASISLEDLNNPLTMVDTGTSRELLKFINELQAKIDSKEIKTSTIVTPEAINIYMGKVANAIPQNPYPNIAEDDIFIEAIEKNDFRKIDEYINYYKISVSKMKQIVVPAPFQEIHKREIELFMATQKVYESVKEINNDPLKTVLALQENQKIREEMVKLIDKLLQMTANFYE
ncbi:MAG: hypothetical protein ABII97_01740 [Patescibacteria group bacterium]